MKNIIFEKYKLVNVSLFIIVLIVFAVMNLNYNKWFQGADIDYIYKVFDSIYHPVMVSAKWLAAILGVLLLFPARIFRKWLFYIAPVVLLLTWYLVQGISVYSSNLLNPTRAKMAENGMMLLAAVTVVFVIGHLVYDRRKNKATPAA
jgi:hypothetical protein